MPLQHVRRTLELSCEAPLCSGFVSFNSLFDAAVDLRDSNRTSFVDPTPSRQEVSAGVNHPNHGNLAREHLVDETIPPKEQLAKLILPQLGNDAAPLRKSRERT